VAERPYTLLSCCMSIDGFIDGASESRLVLSDREDLDRVDRVRAAVDAILVGATTVRDDNPRLLVRDPGRRAARVARGEPETPAKVTLTSRGELDASLRFFADDGSRKLVYCANGALGPVSRRVGSAAEVLDGGSRLPMSQVVEDLHDKGIRRLMVEGGGAVHTQFLTEDLVDELQLVVAPFFVGDPGARRFVGEGRFPWHAGRRATLAGAHPVGDVVLLRYALSDRFEPDPGLAGLADL
jgi:5-amino-6-(5-phosphoribosylamino)uracil reductase